MSRTESLLNTRRETILNAVPEAKRGTAEALFERVDLGLEDLKEKVKPPTNQASSPIDAGR